MEAILKNEWLAKLLIKHRNLITEYWIRCIRDEDIAGYAMITDEQLRAELPPTVDSMIYAFQTGDTEGPRKHSVGVIRHRLTLGIRLPDLQMSLHALQTAVMRIVLEAGVGVKKELEALNAASMMYYMVALIAAEVYEQLRAEQQKRFTTTYEFGIALNRSLEMDEVLHTAVDKVAEYIGGDSVAIVLMRSEGHHYELRAYHNLDSKLIGALASICESLDCGKAYADICTIDDVRESVHMEKWAALLTSHGRTALACAPLLAQRTQLGQLVVLWSQPHAFSASETSFLLAMSNHVASAIQNAVLYEEAQGKRDLDILLNASRVLASSLNTRDILKKTARMAAEAVRADLAVVFTYDHQKERARRASHYAGRRASRSMVKRLMGVLVPSAEEGESQSAGTADKQPVLYEGRSECPEMLRPVADVIGSAMIIPLVKKNSTLGAFVLTAVENDAFGEKDLALATGLADLAAVAVENAQLYEHEFRIAETLQRSFIPTELPDLEGYETAAYYRPSRAEASVGGDFYDIFTTNDGCISIIMGDVSGKGLDAAVPTAMGKYTARAYAVENPRPSDLLARFNRAFDLTVHDDTFMTVFYGTLDPLGNSFTYVSAGHNPPLLYSAASKCVSQIHISGLGIGIMPDTNYSDTTIQLHPGDVLLIYTDGATDVKANGDRLEVEGLERLFQSCAHKSAEEIASDVFDGISDYGHGRLPDDVALVVLKRKSE